MWFDWSDLRLSNSGTMPIIRPLCFFVLLVFPALADIGSSQGALRVETVLPGVEEPWGLAFVSDDEFLVTERGGRLLWSRNGDTHPISGVPEVFAEGQGGLLDVMLPRDFADSHEVFLSFAIPQTEGAGTALGVGRLNFEHQRLEAFRVIFEMTPGSSGGRHFGGRIVEARDGTIFLTTGDRGDRPSAQDRSRHNGSVIRILRDGSIPPDNPFAAGGGGQPEIWSFGHRNPQGAALDLEGNLWVNEHGARGGDEVNRIEPGANFGWPVIAYGRHYSYLPIGEGTHKEGMEQPAHYWDPSIAPSGLMIYSGRLWPEWRGHFFVGSLKFGYIARLDPDQGWAEEQLQSEETGRVRDVREAPDGSIWFLSVIDGAVYRVTPAD